MLLKIFSLNLMEGQQWEERIFTIISEIQKYNPDIVILQEVILDKSKAAISTVEQLNKELRYSNFTFCPCFDYSVDYGKGILQKNSALGGLGILSNLSFSSIEQNLPIVVGVDRRPRKALICDFGTFTLANVHFSNKSFESRDLQRKELIKTDIIVGDFNTLPDELATRLINESYLSSYDYVNYISYPSKRMTLDYCLIKRGKFKKVTCLDKNISDHVALFYEIEI